LRFDPLGNICRQVNIFGANNNRHILFFHASLV
jgi:hypothetical protein